MRQQRSAIGEVVSDEHARDRPLPHQSNQPPLALVQWLGSKVGLNDLCIENIPALLR
jgi:hypothetical protein